YGCSFGSGEDSGQRQGRWAQCGSKWHLQSRVPGDAGDYEDHRAGVARRQHLRFGGWGDVGGEVSGRVSAEVLLRGVAATARSDGASRREICAGALGSGALGARDRNADVRVWRDVEGSADGDFERG